MVRCHKCKIDKIDESGIYRLRDKDTGALYENVLPLLYGEQIKVGLVEGADVLALNTGTGSIYIIGIIQYAKDVKNGSEEHASGRFTIKAGEGVLVKTEENGDIGIYRKKDVMDKLKQYHKIFEYKADSDMLTLNSTSIYLKAVGNPGKGNFIMDRDRFGNFIYIFEGKLHAMDKTSRFRLKFSNPVSSFVNDNLGTIAPSGACELMVDNAPMLAQPKPGISMLPNDYTIIRLGVHSDAMYGNLIFYFHIGLAGFPIMMMCVDIMGKTKIKTLGDIDIYSLGNIKAKSFMNVECECNGNITMKAGGDIVLKTNGDTVLKVVGDTVIKAGGDVNIECGGQASVKSVSGISLETSGDLSLKSSTMTIDTLTLTIPTDTAGGGFNALPNDPTTGIIHSKSSIVAAGQPPVVDPPVITPIEPLAPIPTSEATWK